MSKRPQARSRNNSVSSSTAPKCDTEPPSLATNMKREPRDTGFPEPFQNGPNTTLPHPEADLSPNATLSYEDVSTERILKRHRLSFLKKNKRTVSYGTLDPHSEALHSIVSLSMLDFDGGHKQAHPISTTSTTSLRLCKDGGDSVHSSSKKAEGDTPPTSPDVSEHRHKLGLLSSCKWN